MARETTLNLVIQAKNATKRALSGAQRGIKSFTTRARSRFRRMREAIFSVRGAIAGIAGAAALGTLAKRIFDLGSDAVETANKYERVFGPAVQRVTGFLDDWRRMAGLARSEARELAASAGGLARAFGFGTEEAAEFSTQILRTAGDMASFNNVTAERATDALISALAGEREQLKQLNVVIRESDVQQKALAMTGKESAEAITDQEKALATLALVQERAEVQMGDLADTQDSAANRARQLGGAYRDAKEALSEVLLPVMVEAVGGFRDQEEAAQQLGDRIREDRREIQDFARTFLQLATAAGRTFLGLGQLIGDATLAVVSGVKAVVMRSNGEILSVVNLAIRGLNRLIEGANKIPGVDIDFRIGELDARRWFEAADQEVQILDTALGSMGQTLSGVASAWGRVGDEAERAARKQREATAAGGGGATTSGGGFTPTPVGGSPITTVGPHLEEVTGTGQQGLQSVREEVQLVDQAFQDLGGSAKQAFAGALQGALLASEGMKKGFLGAIAKMAAAKASFYAAEALAAVARGLLFNDPKAFAAAGQYAKAAAAMGAVAATVGGAAAALSGGGGGPGAAARSGAQAQRDQAGQSRQETTIIIKGSGLLNLNDPRQRRDLERALSGAGSLGNVNIVSG